MLKSKKAQIGETMTWVIATIVIIGILLIFVFIASVFAEKEGMVVSLKRVFSGREVAGVNWLSTKTSLAYDMNSLNKESKIEPWIKEVEE